jgi:peptidoglycan-associated lipoprotein
MKMKNLVLALLIFFAAFTIIGCSSTRLAGKSDDAGGTVGNQSSSVTQTPISPPLTAAVKAPEAKTTDSNSTKDPLNDSSSILSKRSVYFDYDSSTIKSEFINVIEAHGKYLASHQERNLVIQGNTDERGGSEYNLALGQRRAEAVRKLLVLYGAKESQLEAISFGKEKPRATGSNEAAWVENRRVDLAY